jgi:hypothetical protein
MERKVPGQAHEPEVVIDVPDDARGYNQPAWTAGRVFFALIALAMMGAALLWVGQLLGSAAAILPGGMDALSAAVWGGVGAVGLGLLLVVLLGVRRAGRPSR